MTTQLWNSVSDMVAAYTERLLSDDDMSRVFCYQDPLQYERKLLWYAAVLESLRNDVGSILDVGCGVGELLRHYRPSTTYVGVDVVPAFIERARRNFPDTSFRCANVLTDDVGVFDTCVLLGAMGCSPSPLQLLSRAGEIARGHLLFDYLPSDGSAALCEWLRTFAWADIATVLSHQGWTVTKHARLSSSTAAFHCSKE